MNWIYCGIGAAAAAVLGVAGWWFLRWRKENSFTPPVLTDWDREHLAYHEAGHAVCFFLLPEVEKVASITIDPSNEAFGMVRTAARVRHNDTKEALLSSMTALMGGGISEEIFLHDFTTSRYQDLQIARKIAFDMVTRFGMGNELRNISLMDDGGMWFYSREVQSVAEKEICTLLSEASKRAEELIRANADVIKLLVDELFEKGTMTEADVDEFVKKNIRRNKEGEENAVAGVS